VNEWERCEQELWGNDVSVEVLKARIEKLEYERDTFRAENEKLERLATQALKEASQLRAALKPFAELAEYYDVEPDAQPAWDRDFQPTVGELRAAADALKETGE